MKKIILLLFSVLLLNSCSLDGETFAYEVLPVDSFEVPDSFVLGETYEIKVFYKRPTTCYEFNGFYYHKDLNIRTIAVQTLVRTSGTCNEITDNMPPEEVSFNFHVTSNGSYIFKFYKGKDAEGIDIFEEVEIPVED